MADRDALAAVFEEHRGHLRAVAYRLLGSMTDADDAVQDTWLRLASADISEVENLGGWLTTVVSQPPRFSTSLVSEPVSRSQVSCTASSASVIEPSSR